MTTGEAIFSKARSNTPLTALVGERIYPVTAGNNQPGAYIIWQKIGGIPASTHGEPAGLAFSSFQFACFGENYEAAASVRNALISAFDNQTLGTGEAVTLDDAGRDDFDEAGAIGNTIGIFRCDADFIIRERLT